MKSKVGYFIGVIALACFTNNLWASELTGSDTTTINSDTATVSYNPDSFFYLAIGDSIQLYDSVITKGNAIWKVSDKTIATISNKGLIKGIKEGFVVIYTIGLDSSIITKSRVQVYYPSTDSSIVNIPDSAIIPPNSYSLVIGESISLKPDARISIPYTWRSSENSIASVDQQGNVKGIYPGEATIYMTLSDSSTLSKFMVYVMDSSNYSETENTDHISQNFIKLAIGDQYTLPSTDSNHFTTPDSVTKYAGTYTFRAITVGQSIINEYDKSGNLVSEWIFFVYKNTDSNSVINPLSKTIYLTIGDTATVYDSGIIQTSTEVTIDWSTSGVVEPLKDGLFIAKAIGYTKCSILIPGNTPRYVMIAVSPDPSIGADSLKRIISLPIINATNFIYQNYTAIEQTDTNALRIVFDKEITDLPDIAKYLNIETKDSLCNLCKSLNTVTISSISIDPSNNQAIIVTTAKAITTKTTIAVTFNSIPLLSAQGKVYNGIVMATTNNQTGMALTASDDFAIAPNITESSITILGQTTSTIEIYNTSGQLVEKITPSNTSTTIDVSNYRPGTYILKLKTSKAQTISKRFIKL